MRKKVKMESPPLGFLSSLTRDHLRVKVLAESWKDAVISAGDILVEQGLATDRYPQAMVKTILELGPYCVLAPGIAMPHARPEDGALKTGFSLITLKNPVNFGSKANDPVDIVIGLAALNKNDHIKAMKEMAVVLSNESFITGLRSADTQEALFNLIQEKRKKQ